MTLSGRTSSIISRFPHFYLPEDPNSDFHGLLEIFAMVIEQAEGELEQVLRSHFVGTAENLSSQGFTAAQKGDLDRIFTLYLESLGGTSQLNQVSQNFQESDIKQPEMLLESFGAAEIKSPVAIDPLQQATQAINRYIWERQDQALIKRYQAESARFPDTLQMSSEQAQTLIVKSLSCLSRLPLSRSLKQQLVAFPSQSSTLASVPDPECVLQLQQEMVVVWLLKLMAATDPLTVYLRQQLSSETKRLLDAYDCSIPVPLVLTTALAAELNQKVLFASNLAEPFQECRQFLAIQIDLVKKLGSLKPKALVSVGQFLYGWLSPGSQRSLYDLKPLDNQPPPSLTSEAKDRLLTQLTSEVRPLLSKLRINQQLDHYASGIEAIASNLAETALKLLVEVAQTLLIESLEVSLSKEVCSLPEVPAATRQLLEQNPRGEDRVRLNRLLLEAAYPLELPHSQIPSRSDICQGIAKAFNDNLLSDRAFYLAHQPFFAQISPGTELQLLLREVKSAQPDSPLPSEKLTRLNRLLLEAVYPTQLEKSDTPYRERLKRLIEVLKNGASTRDGIVDIVAANLGMSRDRATGQKPWESFLFSFSLDQEIALDHLIASKQLREIFQSKHAIQLSLSTTVTIEELDRDWLITDATEGRVFRVYRQDSVFNVYEQLIRVIEFLPDSRTTAQKIHPSPFSQESTLQITNQNVSPTVPTLAFQISDIFSDLYDELPLQRLTETHASDLLDALKNQRSLPENLKAELGLKPQEQTEIHEAHKDLKPEEQTQTQTIQQNTEWLILVSSEGKRSLRYRIQQDGNLKIYRERRLPPLTHLSLRQATENAITLQYKPALDYDQRLEWTVEGIVAINSVPIANPEGAKTGDLPALPPGQSDWLIEARVNSEESRFDTTLFDFSCFDSEQSRPLTPEQASTYQIEVRTTFYESVPGRFMVRIPWDIPGYTDRFNETIDHPRHQIHALIEKVRAAGVSSVIVYEKQFPAEIQDMQDHLTLKETSQTRTSKPYGQAIVHDISDEFLTCAVFDFTCFDTMNGFG